MKVLVVGGGGREHALAWKIADSPLVTEVIAAPGNDGMRKVARCEPVAANDIEAQIRLAEKESVDLVVVGPEDPLVSGLSDALVAKGIPVFGPSAKAAMLEGSKIFAKEFMKRHDIPTAPFSVHKSFDDAVPAIDERDGICVVKADGLAAGKGVFVCKSRYEGRQALRQILQERKFGAAGDRIIVEDRLDGEEASVLAISDGERIVTLVAAQDHKAAFEGDVGPNTGGMGAYAPAPVVTPPLQKTIEKEILQKTVLGMAAEGTPFKGVLYAGLMIRNGKPYVLEYNVRFGDPECQPLLMLLKEDLVPLLVQSAKGMLEERELIWRAGSTVCVVLASDGYPGTYTKGKTIDGLGKTSGLSEVCVFHAGTRLEGDKFVTAGGRVLGVTAVGKTLEDAVREAYAAANQIHFDGMRMRRDIGHRAL